MPPVRLLSARSNPTTAQPLSPVATLMELQSGESFWTAMESRVRDDIKRRIARERLTVKVSMHAANGSWPGRVKLNAALARAYARELNRLAKELKLAGPVTLETLVRAPGVLETDEELSDAESFWPAVAKALRKSVV